VKPALKILLADDHAVVRAGLRSLLEDIKGVGVVGEAEDGEAAVALTRSLKPDVVIMDIGMQRLNGLEATARITKELSGVKVIILSMHNTKEYVLQALRAGASAYLVKDSAPVELELALTALQRGDTYLSGAVSKQVIDHCLETEDRTLPRTLTPRQGEVLALIARGHSTKEIARRLSVSVKTVETHRLQLMARLGINDIAGLVRYAIRVGLVDVAE
jgi:DNA-binding NarL/FixJ family response regulator